MKAILTIRVEVLEIKTDNQGLVEFVNNDIDNRGLLEVGKSNTDMQGLVEVVKSDTGTIRIWGRLKRWTIKVC